MIIFKQKESRSIAVASKITNNCSKVQNTYSKRNREKELCVSEFVLYDTSFERTGLYTCYYSDAGHMNNFNSDSIYIFVNGNQQSNEIRL